MPLALILIVFILMFATLVTSTIAWQIVGDRTETSTRAANWALDSTLNQASENIGSSTMSLTGVPTTAPATWSTSSDGTYAYRWWIDSSANSASLAASPASGSDATCALMTDTTVKCWGQNNYGQLGNGTNILSSVPVPVSNLSGAIEVGTSDAWACAVINSGQVKCWGNNAYGELGTGTAGGTSSVPQTVTGISTATQVTLGTDHACALLADTTVKCWGLGTSGQLGNGTTTSSSTPVVVSGLTGVTSVEAGRFHTCALLTGGSVKCWGYNADGQLGTGNTLQSSTPTAAVISGVTALAPGWYSTCALMGDTTVKCWGRNTSGQLGNETTTTSFTPVTVTGLTGATQITGGTDSNCALLSDSTVKCWGGNANGQLGNGGSGNKSTPVSVTGLTNVVDLVDGYSRTHPCVKIADGTGYCWGLGTAGQLGNGILADSSTPVKVTGTGPAAGLVTVTAQIKMIANPGAGIAATDAPYQGTATFYWDPINNRWILNGQQSNA